MHWMKSQTSNGSTRRPSSLSTAIFHWVRKPAIWATIALALPIGRADSVVHAAVPARGGAACFAGWPAIQTSIAKDVAAKRYPGAIFIVRSRGTVHTGVAGMHDTATGQPVREDTIFRLASMSKPITAAAIMILVDQGKLKLDDPVGWYIPDFAHMQVGQDLDGGYKNAGRPLTVRNLLTHTSGFEGDEGSFTKLLQSYGKRQTLASEMAMFASLPLAWDPGTKYHYSAVVGFDILSRIVEIVSRQPFDRFLKLRIFNPLGMKDTTFVLDKAQKSRLAGLYLARSGSFYPAKSPFASDTYFSGAAGLYGTASDYLRFTRMLASDGRVNGVRILSRQAVVAMRSEQLKPGFPGLGSGVGWGLGMRTVASDPVLPTGSYGWSGAFGTHFWIDPQHGIEAVFMMNLANGGGADAPTARAFERAVADASYCPKVTR